MRHIFNFIPICLLEEVGGWEGHSDDSFCYVGKVQLDSLVICGPFRASHYFPDQLKHASDKFMVIVKDIKYEDLSMFCNPIKYLTFWA